MAEPTEVVLRTEGLTAGYGGPPVIEDVSLAVHAGRITAIWANGSMRWPRVLRRKMNSTSN